MFGAIPLTSQVYCLLIHWLHAISAAVLKASVPVSNAVGVPKSSCMSNDCKCDLGRFAKQRSAENWPGIRQTLRQGGRFSVGNS